MERTKLGIACGMTASLCILIGAIAEHRLNIIQPPDRKPFGVYAFYEDALVEAGIEVELGGCVRIEQAPPGVRLSAC